MNTEFLTSKEKISDIAPDELLNLCSYIQELFLHACDKNSLQELEQLLSDHQHLLFAVQSAMMQTEKSADNINIIVFHLGVLTELLTLTEKLYASKKAAKFLSRPHTVYKDQIAEILYQNGAIMHKTLAEKLNITPNNLSNIIRRLKAEEVPLIEETIVGKYKYYTLNRTGRNYVKMRLSECQPPMIKFTQQPTTSKEPKALFKKQQLNLDYDFKQHKKHWKMLSPQFYTLVSCNNNTQSRELSARYKQMEKESRKEVPLKAVQ